MHSVHQQACTDIGTAIKKSHQNILQTHSRSEQPVFFGQRPKMSLKAIHFASDFPVQFDSKRMNADSSYFFAIETWKDLKFIEWGLPREKNHFFILLLFILANGISWGLSATVQFRSETLNAQNTFWAFSQMKGPQRKPAKSPIATNRPSWWIC